MEAVILEDLASIEMDLAALIEGYRRQKRTGHSMELNISE
jgi:hypothetical protein